MVEIVPLEDRHKPEWLPLWKGYQRFYEVDIDGDTTDLTWRRLMDPSEPMFVLGACADGRLVGIVHFLFHRSTWTTGDYCYLQDLFTAPDARGAGVGRALIAAVCDHATAQGASRVYWLTREDNATAIALYEKVALRTGFIQYRIGLPAG
jgi:ribosomal protein S18 acetylase RimI-like enzyme